MSPPGRPKGEYRNAQHEGSPVSTRTGWRWIPLLAATLLLFLIAIGVAVAVAWTMLPLDRATLVVDGETVALPGLSGWQAGLGLTMALFAVVLASVVAIAIAIGVALLGIGAAAIVVALTMVLAASPLLLAGWLIWRMTRPTAKPEPRSLGAPA